MDSPLARFLLVGIANTLVGYSTILFFQFVVGLSPVAANAAGFGVGMSLSYFLNRRYAFRSNRRHGAGLPLFFAAAGVCFGLNLVVLHGAAVVAGMPIALAQALAVTAYTGLFFLASRFIVFRDSSS